MQLPSSVSTRLQYQHQALLDLVDDLSDEQIRKQIHTGKWSIFENLVHLQTYQHLFVERIRKILEGETPSFKPYVAEADPLFHENCGKSSREIIQDLLATRKELATGILSFREEDFRKEAVHAGYGRMNLLQWVHFFLLHEAHHLFTIFKLAAETRKPTGL